MILRPLFIEYFVIILAFLAGVKFHSRILSHFQVLGSKEGFNPRQDAIPGAKVAGWQFFTPKALAKL